MPDLVEKYFTSDLNDGEQEALSRLLLDSEDAALKFERMAKEAYERFGLPEPKPRWNDGPPKAGMNWRLWSEWVIFAGMLGAGWLAWVHFKGFLSTPGPATTMKYAVSAAKSGVQGIRAQAAPFPPRPNKGGPSTENNGERKVAGLAPGRSAPAIPTPVSAPAGPPPSAMAAPVNLDSNPGTKYSNLSVAITQPQMGFLSVWVEDPRGASVKTLFNGVLNPGNWMFQWDGKLSYGPAALPGFYQIVVRSGSSVQRKSVQIQ